MNIQDKLVDKNNFSNTEKDLADYILNHKDEVINMSVHELAKASYTSSAAIIRLCKKINVKGFSEFKIHFSAELQKRKNDINSIDSNFPFEKSDSFFEITKKMYELSINAIYETYNLTSINEYKKAVSLIKKSNHFALFACGDSFIRALDFQNKMMKIGKLINLTTIPVENSHLALALNENDCALFISYSGQSHDIVETAHYAKKQGVPIILITGRPNSKLGKIADIILEVTSSESQSIKFSTFASQTGIEYVLNCLYAYFFIDNYDKNAQKRVDTEMKMIDSRK